MDRICVDCGADISNQPPERDRCERHHQHKIKTVKSVKRKFEETYIDKPKEAPPDGVITIPGELMSLLTFPGVILHELGHEIFCWLGKVKVKDVAYFRVGKNPAGYVLHEPVKTFTQAFLVFIGPYVFNTLIGVSAFMYAAVLQDNPYVFYPMMWLGISAGVNSFPSTDDSKSLWKSSIENIKRRNILAVVGIPFAALFYIASLLSHAWFDFFYAFALAGVILAGV